MITDTMTKCVNHCATKPGPVEFKRMILMQKLTGFVFILPLSAVGIFKTLFVIQKKNSLINTVVINQTTFKRLASLIFK